MENDFKHENNSDSVLHAENKPETGFSASAVPCSNSSREDVSTAVQVPTSSKFYVPFWGSVFCIMASSGFVCSYSVRVGLSVAIVAMINRTAIGDDDIMTLNTTNTSDTDQCPRDTALQHIDGEFTWDRHQQGNLLAAFFYGLIITQVWMENTSYSQLKTAC